MLLMLAVLTLGSTWYLVSRLNAESGMATAVRKARNAEVLNEAKQALVGYVAMQAAEVGENNPGRLPCPEAAGNIDGTNDGIAAPNCTLPAIGRFPWRTIGMNRPEDSTGEPLWYVVSPGWALSNSTTPPLTTYINSNSNGRLLVNAKSVSTLTRAAALATAVSTNHGFKTGDIVKIAGAVPVGYNVSASVTVVDANTFTFVVDSTLSTPATGTIKAGDAAVALLIAPGTGMNVVASTNCAARNQARSVPSSSINALDYLECYDTANSTFSTTGPSGSFNDQVLTVTAADVMPGIEAAVAGRIKDQIVPALKTVYTHTTWGFTTPGITPNNPILPFAAPFANPGPGAGTSDYVGAAGTYQGLLPFNQVQGCTLSAADPRCALPVFAKSTNDTMTAGSGSIRTQSTCSWQSTDFVCTGEYLQPSISVTVQIKAYVATGLRTTSQTLPWTASSPVANITFTAMNDSSGGWGPQSISHTVTASALGSDGSVTLTIAGSLLPDIATAGWGTYANYRVSISSAVFGDHSLLNTTDPSTGWFARNEWYRLLYYAIPQSSAAARLPLERSCGPTAANDCLPVANATATSDTIAPLLLLMGRSVNSSSRPSATLSDYLESTNATGTFTKKNISAGNAIPVAQRFNDRVVFVGSN